MTDDIVAYMGWGISAREQIDGLRREVRELKAENARLRAARDTWAENDAKLRELVRDMFRDFARADYELKSRCGRTFMAVTRYEPRLRELGVEVSDD